MFALTYTDECKSVVPTRHQVNFSLQQMETIILKKKLHTIKMQSMEPIPSGYIYKRPLY